MVRVAPGNQLIDPNPGNNANCYWSGYTIGFPYYRTEVGAFDQGGNVWEWIESVVYEGGGYSSRVLRGGSVYCNDTHLLASGRYYYNYPTFEDFDMGFRVSEVPEPTSMAILASGGIVMLVRRRGLGI